MCILEKLNFKIFRGSTPSDSPSVVAPSALDPAFARLTPSFFHRACICQWVIVSIVLRILNTQKQIFSFFSLEKGTPSVLYRDIYFKDC